MGDIDKTQSLDTNDLPRLDRKSASLLVVEGKTIGAEYRLAKAEMVIGRDTEADIYVDDHLASRSHAKVTTVRNDAGEIEHYVHDLGSTNGTFANNRRISSVQLCDGDKVRIGRTVLKFVLADEVDERFHRTIRDMITFDELTGLLTKRSLYQELERELSRSSRYKHPLSVLMMDLDHFKLVNDHHGHQAGSFVLAQVGRIIQATIREPDLAGRYGGEEFIACLPETDKERAIKAAERVRVSLEATEMTPPAHEGPPIRITISIGVSSYPDDGADLDDLVRQADRALYRCKHEGRNRVLAAERQA